MKSFNEFLFEAFDKPAKLIPIENSRADIEKTANIDGYTFIYKMFNKRLNPALQRDDNSWYFSFSSGMNTFNIDPKGHKTSLKVMATAIEFLKDFGRNYPNHTSIVYEASSSEPSRVKLYTTMTKLLARKYGYDYKIVNGSGDVAFKLEKK